MLRTDTFVRIEPDTKVQVYPRGPRLPGAILAVGDLESMVRFTFTTPEKLRETVAQLQAYIDERLEPQTPAEVVQHMQRRIDAEMGEPGDRVVAMRPRQSATSTDPDPPRAA
jgi:hypothetical protein